MWGDEKMLKILHASFPSPFAAGLEYNSPAHGSWNIVHMGMLVPEAHQIYVCTPNCARGVILTAAEMNAMDRMSSISLTEEDFVNGDMEELIIDGVGEILANLRYQPKVILLFTVCVHHFMGTDLDYIYDTLRKQYPEYRFVDCYMDPIMQKGGLTPDQKLRIGMYQCLEKAEQTDQGINIIGNDLPVIEDSEIINWMKEHGRAVRDITACNSYEEYQSMSKSSWNMIQYPAARVGGQRLSDRLGQNYLYIPQIYNYQRLREQQELLYQQMGLPLPEEAFYQKLIRQCEEKITLLRHKLSEKKVAIDHSVVPYYLSLAKFLLEHHIPVTRIYGDSFMPEEEETFQWICDNYPDIDIFPTIDVRMRTLDRNPEDSYLAVGQKAAYFTGSSHFVNMVEGGGLFGIRGIYHMIEEMIEALDTEKDTRDLIVRKGLGCISCI